MATKGLAFWSETAGTNATADSSVNFAEGQAPSSLNDSCRGLMASAARWRNDVSGNITTAGTSTAYTATTSQDFATLAQMNAQIITIVPHATNGVDPTLAVNGLAAKQIRTATGVNVANGTMIAGTPYQLVYFSSAGEFILMGFANNPYNVPLASGMDYWGTSAPNSNFAFAYGQAISRTTYAALFAIMGTTHGVGDASTTFNIPDKRGRVSAGKDDMGGSSADRLTNQTNGIDGDTLGATGGEETHAITQGQLPAVSPTFTGVQISLGTLSSTQTFVRGDGTGTGGGAGGFADDATRENVQTLITPFTPSGTISALGSGTRMNVVQHTIIAPYIIRII